MRVKYKLILALLSLLASESVSAQSDTAVTSGLVKGVPYRFYLNTNAEATGFLVDWNLEWITLEKRPSHVRIEIRRSTVVKVERLSLKDVYSDIQGENHHAGTYLAGNSALLFEADVISTTAHWLVFDHSQYAFTENWAFQVSSIFFYPVGVGVKCAFQVAPSTYLGGSVNTYVDYGFDNGRFGLFLTTGQFRVTQGTTNRNFTLGAGLLGMNGSAFGNTGNNSRSMLFTPSLSAGFCDRFAKRWSVVFDGHVLPDEGLLLGGAGFKFLRSEDVAWTFGCYFLSADAPSPGFTGRAFTAAPIPYIGYAWKSD